MSLAQKWILFLAMTGYILTAAAVELKPWPKPEDLPPVASP